MPKNRHYILTCLAESDLREARLWSISRWGKELTRGNFNDLHEAAEFVATHRHTLNNKEDLTGDTGLCIHPVREHYLVYIPVGDQFTIIVAVIRQSRDVPRILGKVEFMIRREVMEIRNRITRGVLTLPE